MGCGRMGGELPRTFSILLNLGVPVASASEVRSPAIELGNLVAGGVVEGAGHDSQQRHHAGVVDLGLQESLLWRRGWEYNSSILQGYNRYAECYRTHCAHIYSHINGWTLMTYSSVFHDQIHESPSSLAECGISA